jgi:hypothetical protein
MADAFREVQALIQPEGESMTGAVRARRILVVGAFVLLGLSVNELVLHGVLYTDTLMRWYLLGGH